MLSGTSGLETKKNMIFVVSAISPQLEKEWRMEEDRQELLRVHEYLRCNDLWFHIIGWATHFAKIADVIIFGRRIVGFDACNWIGSET